MIPNIYKGNYYLLAIPPLLLLLISFYLILISPQIPMGVDFKGGTLISLTLNENVDPNVLREAMLAEGFDAEVSVFETSVGIKAEIEVPQSEDIYNADLLKESFTTLLDEASLLELQATQDNTLEAEAKEKRKELDAVADQMFEMSDINNKSASFSNLNHLNQKFQEAYKVIYDDYKDSISSIINKYTSYSAIQIQMVSPKLSTHFLTTARSIVLFAAILTAIFVFIFFRTLVPSLAVLSGAFCDVVIAMGGMAYFGIPLTLPSFAALLMLIGFSLDTDILLTMRMLKRKGDPKEHAFDAMKTGMTMSIMAIVSFSALFILGVMTHISTYYEIAGVALIGLIGDLFATWGINAVIILCYVLKRGEA